MDSRFQADDQNLIDAKLEVEFRQILCIIKNSIIYVNSTYNLSFYRAWLEKLNSLNVEKILRNNYLIRLARQIRGNYLSYPFNQYPPSGTLEKIEDNYSEVSDIILSKYFDCNYNLNIQGDMDNIIYSDEEPQRLLQVGPVTCKPTSINTAIVQNPQSSHQEYDEIEGTIMKVPIKLKKHKQKLNLPYEPLFANDNPDDCPTPVEEPVQDARIGKLGNIQEDSSWYDLSDSSLTSVILNPLGSGDAARRAKKVRDLKENSNEICTKEETSKKPG